MIEIVCLLCLGGKEGKEEGKRGGIMTMVVFDKLLLATVSVQCRDTIGTKRREFGRGGRKELWLQGLTARGKLKLFPISFSSILL